MKAVAKAAAFLYEGMWMVRELCVSYSQNAVAGYANFLVSISLGVWRILDGKLLVMIQKTLAYVSYRKNKFQRYDIQCDESKNLLCVVFFERIF